MDVIELLPQLHFIRFPVGHAYLWHDSDGLTLIDTGLPGSAPLLSAAVRRAGYQPADLRRVVLTHFHADHAGGAAGLTAEGPAGEDGAAWGEVEVLAPLADVPFILGQAAGPPADLADWERPLYEQVTSQRPADPVVPPRIDRTVGDGDELGFGGGAVTVAAPGHTPGSIAVYLPRHQVLFTGDAAARRGDGAVVCGVFNCDRAQAAASLRRLCGLSVTVACFGHGEPLVRGHAGPLARDMPGKAG